MCDRYIINLMNKYPTHSEIKFINQIENKIIINKC